MTRPHQLGDKCLRIAEKAEARALLEALEGRESPATTPRAGPIVSPPAAAPAAPTPHVETPDLIRRLTSPVGPSIVEAVVRRLNEKLGADFEPLYRKCCREVLAGRLPVGVMVAGFHWARDAGRGIKKGPSFAAYIKQAGEDRAPPGEKGLRRVKVLPTTPDADPRGSPGPGAEAVLARWILPKCPP